MSPAKYLSDILQQASEDARETGLLVYKAIGREKQATRISYKELLQLAELRSYRLRSRQIVDSDKVVLLHFDNTLDGVIWYWAVVLSGLIPCISPPLTKDIEQRKKQILHLQKLLQDPLVITTETLYPEFSGINNLDVQTITDIVNAEPCEPSSVLPSSVLPSKHQDIAVLMLTSGSSGYPKAVELRHDQIMEAVKGKAAFHRTNGASIFMNWVGLDHVANLTEIHLQAMYLSAEQIHVPKEIVSEPLLFLDLIEEHAVSYTFAPNFFLASMVRSLIDKQLTTYGAQRHTKRDLDLSSLRALISGGESNVVETCSTLTLLLQKYRAPRSFIRPGFGMTETCAGSIYSEDCPSYDEANGTEFASVGLCIKGISMRIMRDEDIVAGVNEIGALQLSGPVIFRRYYNNPEATEETFSKDGWFKTGDMARLDARGILHIAGREKDTLVINGVNHAPHAIEAAIGGADIPGIAPSYTVVFAHRPKGSPTEALYIVYFPTYDKDDIQGRVDATLGISKAIVTYCGIRPYKVIPLDSSLLIKSSLGKLSRVKIRKAFEEGAYLEYEEANEKIIRDHRQAVQEFPDTETEMAILDVFRELFNTGFGELSINDNLFEIGISSVDLLKFKQHLQSRLCVEIPLTIFFTYPVVRDLGEALEELQNVKEKEYEPVVILQPQGFKTPLWFVHPGVGEVLVFMNLARYLTDRPVYALRARGFDGEPFFESTEEIVETYHAAIKRVQPKGPYAICGYSFGSILTFEITKLLEAAGEEVKFVGVLDQPPHFKKRAQGYDWYEVTCTLAFFLGLIEEWYAYDIIDSFRQHSAPRKEVLAHIFELAPAYRLDELGLSKQKFANWANLAYELKVVSSFYDPQGTIKMMDVFYVEPLPIVDAKTIEEWFDGHISKWKNFVQESHFHQVEGGHRTLISPPHVIGFQKLLKNILKEKGL